MTIHAKFDETIRKHKLISRGERIIIGVSGGSDSVALLYLLNSVKNEYRLSLLIAHLDHGLRKDSWKDRDLVFELGKKLMIPVVCERASLNADGKGSIEENARNARLNFFRRLSSEFKFSKVALGHTMDDQAETILMRILRGSGLYGLAGIIPSRDMQGLMIIRPLINITRKEIDRFIQRKRLRTVTDKSNLTDIYFRNKIRRKLLPGLTVYNPNIKEILCNMAEHIRWDYDYLIREAESSWRKSLCAKSSVLVKLRLSCLAKLHPSILRLVLRLSYKHLKGDTRRLTFRHISEIESLIYARPSGSVIDLPHRISVRKDILALTFRIN